MSDLTCECETNPAMIEGPAEHCLVHGNPRLFAELLEQAEVQLAEAVDALRGIRDHRPAYSANWFQVMLEMSSAAADAVARYDQEDITDDLDHLSGREAARYDNKESK